MKKQKNKSAIGISAVSYFLPPRSLTVAQLSKKRLIQSEIAAVKKFGFRKIFVAEKLSAGEMAELATKKILKSSGVSPDTIDVILYSSALPSTIQRRGTHRDPAELFLYPGLKLQYEFGMRKARVIGISQAGCVSFLQSLQIAFDMIKSESDIHRVLCVSSDRLPEGSKREILYNLISDASCAAIIERSTAINQLISYHQVSKGFYWDSRKMKNEIIASYFSTSRFVMLEALKKAKLTLDDIALIIPHNVNAQSWMVLLKMLGVPKEKFYGVNIAKYGHTIAADNVINLADAVRNGRLRSGDHYMLFTFGFGAHWGCYILKH